MSQDTSKANGARTADMIASRLRSLLAQREQTPKDEIPEGFPVTAADIRQKFGFAPDDPNVTVKVIPLGSASDDIPGYDDFLKGLSAAIDGEPVGGVMPPNPAPRSKMEIISDLLDVSQKLASLSDELGIPFPPEIQEAINKWRLPDEDTAASEVAAAAAAAECPVQSTHDNRMHSVFADVWDEVVRAQEKHGPMHSPHEGISVIREEFEELWDHVKADTGFSAGARKEAVQVAAMAIRYLLDLNPALV